MPALTLSLAQRDAYVAEQEVRVLRCAPHGDRFVVTLDETIFYATGGGQPADRGTLGPVRVLDVARDQEGTIVHTVDGPLEPGTVQARLDWARRYDFMQQHTAQHLLTAIADDELGLPTVSFHLGEDYSAIELACAAPPAPEVWEALARRAQEEIRAARPVRWRAVSVAEYRELPGVRSRGLPDGHRGDVRLVEIEGLDLNTCGGTHVASTAELQAIHLGRVESTTDGVRVRYLAGGRTLAQMREWADREAALSALLTCAPRDFEDNIRKLRDELRALGREVRELRAATALHEAMALRTAPEATVARPIDTADPAVLASIADAVGGDKLLVLIGHGIFLVAGAEAAVAELGPRVRDALAGRGGGRGGRFQGKFAAEQDIAVALGLAQTFGMENA